MKLPFRSRAREYLIDRLDLDDTHHMALLHEEDFARAWSAEEFEGLMVQEGVFGFAAREIGNRPAGPAGFCLARLAAGEGEILTVAVRRDARRLGLGRDLVEAVMRELHSERAEALFLEVDETNQPALALYRRLRFYEVGRRPAYYEHPGGTRTGALVLRRDITTPPAPPAPPAAE
jgi:[ribosomal protein S18]-alanine N-acetyltransferase